jgi:uncharacterized damage-inducible protein DinB
MSLTLSVFVDGLRGSRAHFLKHLSGLTPEQWVWKPYAECKNIVETVQHLIIDDSAALDAIRTGKEIDYDSYKVTETNPDKLLVLLKESSDALIGFVQETYTDADIDKSVSGWGHMMPLPAALALFSSEDYYHSGQVAYIRMATDPTWNYYAVVYA